MNCSGSWSRTSNQPGQSRLANRRWSPPGMEPSPGADPGLPPYRGRVTAVCDGRAPAQAMAVASASRTNVGLRAHAGARCPRCDSNAHSVVLSNVSAIGLRGRGASGRPRTAYLPRTRGPLCQVSYRGVAGEPGFEPGRAWPSPGSEPGVLPVTPFPTDGRQLRPTSAIHPVLSARGGS
jgi:hypothetical protein